MLSINRACPKLHATKRRTSFFILLGISNVRGSTTARQYNADQNGYTPIQWNSWKTTWTGTSISTKVGAWRHSAKKKQSRTTTTTTTKTTNQTRSGIRYKITPVLETTSLGDKVVSVDHVQFMRDRKSVV